MRLQRPILLALAVVSLLWVAVYNGYPLVWWDSGSYIYTSCRLEVLPSRPVFYGLFLLATHWRLTLWSSIVAQAALLVYVLRVVLDDEDGGRTAAVSVATYRADTCPLTFGDTGGVEIHETPERQAS